ncbi:MAG: DUF2993 domain-containing protein, partial [Elainellaceae cyanobacterium]
ALSYGTKRSKGRPLGSAVNWITILLASLTGLFATPGVGVQEVAEQSLRNQIEDAETLAIRIDAAPTHQFLSGQIDQVRIAGRGILIQDGVRIDHLDLETDAIDLDINQLRNGNIGLDQPLRAVVRLELTTADINQALQSPSVTQSLQDLSLNVLGEGTIGGFNRSDVVAARFTVPQPGRVQLETQLQEQGTGQGLAIRLGLGVAIANGYQFQLTDPELVANGEAFPSGLLTSLVEGVSREFTLRNLEAAGITARLLELEVEADRVQVVAFVEISPDAEIFAADD